uniref:Secreted protein n=1 Tax=Opuntia streptacantha TaxID=393608 RepID=A0A7C9E1F9_OPUST
MFLVFWSMELIFSAIAGSSWLVICNSCITEALHSFKKETKQSTFSDVILFPSWRFSTIFLTYKEMSLASTVSTSLLTESIPTMASRLIERGFATKEDPCMTGSISRPISANWPLMPLNKLSISLRLSNFFSKHFLSERRTESSFPSSSRALR